jgi:type IV pilus assembly protein PilA
MLQNKKGFTLIELLIVVVIIGILAAIAIPKFANTKEKAYVASMKADLRNLVTAQEAYFSDGAVYAGTLAALGNNYASSTGTSSMALAANSGLGWSAIISHTATTVTCRIGVGTNVTSPDGEGEPVCQ